MKWPWLIGIAAVAAAIWGGWTLWAGVSNDEELGHGDAWAALQTIEFAERGGQVEQPTIRRIPHTEYAALSIPGVGQPSGSPYADPVPKRAWVLLNEHSRDRKIRSLPQFSSYRMSCNSLADIRRSVPDVDDYVMAYLKSVCQA